jgi:hypothetical protein
MFAWISNRKHAKTEYQLVQILVVQKIKKE